MKFLGNLIWLIFGGLETALGYFSTGLALCCTIIGIPWGVQCFKLGVLCLWPFGATVSNSSGLHGCLRVPLNILWFIPGFIIALLHIFFGLLLCVTIIGIPFGRQHFKMIGIALAPFGKEVSYN
ncbi:MAG: YccF domain-containing protein [Paludibacteraceae bacterium]|nr:YccF domain-containing protein [Paludibacteraceae bacterium]